MAPTSVIAVDLGATSGRVVLTSFEDGRLALTEVHRFPTAATRTDAGLQLDVDALYAHIQDGIAEAMRLAGGEVAAVGIDFADVTRVLEEEGVEKFVKSWRELQETVREALEAA